MDTQILIAIVSFSAGFTIALILTLVIDNAVRREQKKQIQPELPRVTGLKIVK